MTLALGPHRTHQHPASSRHLRQRTHAFELEDGQVPDLVVTTSALGSGTSGVAYSAAVAASGGVPPYSWLLTGGALPPGVTLNQSSGALGGTPTASGAFSFTVQATDRQVPADPATRNLSITMASPPP